MKKFLLTSFVILATVCSFGEIAMATETKIDDTKVKVESTKTNEGWQQTNGTWYYYKDGVAQKGWQYIDGEYYYLSQSNGKMAVGWRYINGDYYYLSRDTGAMQKGWQLVDGSYYYLNTDSGKMGTGTQIIDGKEYYLGDNGSMTTGWKHLVDDDNNYAYYYYGTDGAKYKNQWYFNGADWFYLDKVGKMVRDFAEIDGNNYFFESDGSMAVGWALYFDEAEEPGPVCDAYYIYTDSNGILYKNQWLYENENWYYLNNSGYMVTGKHIINGIEYTFDYNGVMQ